jgi:hypothetical protein
LINAGFATLAVVGIGAVGGIGAAGGIGGVAIVAFPIAIVGSAVVGIYLASKIFKSYDKNEV